jgi:hypothetical protein
MTLLPADAVVTAVTAAVTETIASGLTESERHGFVAKADSMARLRASKSCMAFTEGPGMGVARGKESACELRTEAIPVVGLELEANGTGNSSLTGQ